MNLGLLSTLGLILGAFGCATGGTDDVVTDKDISKLAQSTGEANAALVQGDIDGYLAVIKHSKDYTLMAPFGGATTRGFDSSEEHRAAMARFLSQVLSSRRLSQRTIPAISLSS